MPQDGTRSRPISSTDSFTKIPSTKGINIQSITPGRNPRTQLPDPIPSHFNSPRTLLGLKKTYVPIHENPYYSMWEKSFFLAPIGLALPNSNFKFLPACSPQHTVPFPVNSIIA